MNKKFFLREAVGGLTTFLTMSYIIVLNPQIMSSPGTGILAAAALNSTVLLCFVMTLIAGLFIKLPYAIGPGMGVNSFIVFSLIIGKHIPWQTAMGIIFLSSVLFFIVSLTPLRKIIITALPDNLKYAIMSGIGILLAYIGIKNLGLIESSPDTLIKLKPMNVSILLGVLGFSIAFSFFHKRKSYAFLLAIFIVTVIAICLGKVHIPTHLFSAPNFSSFFQLNIFDAFELKYLSIIIALLLALTFDSTASLIAISQRGNFVQADGQPLHLKQTLIVDSTASFVASLFGTTPGLIFLESSAGVEAGAKTGMASVITAFCFLPFLFLAPLLSVIPAYAVAPILIFVGILMSQSLAKIKLNGLDELIPVFLTVVLMPLSSSVTAGVFSGVLSYIFLKVCIGQFKKVSLPLYVIGGICLISLFLEKL